MRPELLLCWRLCWDVIYYLLSAVVETRLSLSDSHDALIIYETVKKKKMLKSCLAESEQDVEKKLSLFTDFRIIFAQRIFKHLTAHLKFVFVLFSFSLPPSLTAGFSVTTSLTEIIHQYQSQVLEGH